jgi:hypothetical protein
VCRPSAAAETSAGVDVGLGRDEFVQQPAHEEQQQDQDDRRDVDAAEIRQQVADRAQHRLRDPVEHLADLGDNGIAHVHHVEGDEPAQDRTGDEDVDEELNNGIEEPDEGVHARI